MATDINDSVHAALEDGFLTWRSLDLDETEEQIKLNPGVIGGMHIINLGTGVRYLKLYDALGTANVTVGSSTPKMTLPIPTLGDTNGAGFLISANARGCMAFGTGIVAAATIDLADAGSAAPGANEVIAHIWYR